MRDQLFVQAKYPGNFLGAEANQSAGTPSAMFLGGRTLKILHGSAAALGKICGKADGKTRHRKEHTTKIQERITKEYH